MIKFISMKEEAEHTYDITRITNRKDGDHCLCGRGGSPAAAFPRYGTDSHRRRDHGEIRAHGRPGGAAHPQLRADPAPGGRGEDRDRKRPGRRERGEEKGGDVGAPSGPWRGRKISSEGDGASPAGGHGADLRPGGQPELRKDDAVQPAHWIQPACGKFPGRDGGP